MRWFLMVFCVTIWAGCGPAGKAPTEEEVAGEALDAEAERALKEFAEYEKTADVSNPTKLIEYIRKVEEVRNKLEKTIYVGKVEEFDRKKARLMDKLAELSYEPMEKATQSARVCILRGDYAGALGELKRFPPELEKTPAFEQISLYKEVLENMESLPEEVKEALKQVVDFVAKSEFRKAYERVARSIDIVRDRYHSIDEEESDAEKAKEKKKVWGWGSAMVVIMGAAVLDKHMSDMAESGEFDKMVEVCSELHNTTGIKDKLGSFINAWAVTAMNRKVERLIAAGQFEAALQFLQGMKGNESFSGIMGNIERWEAQVREKSGGR
ncbi:MAG: hypothetical protein N2234_05945 [Planctomycetota bacterium]|nr:hypothetical protein [Planctomycetota bacterium]